jgi:rhamnulokinase
MIERYLAFDLGAESGRAIVGTLDDEGLLQIEELHRFPNSMIPVRGSLYWDILGMYQQIVEGIRVFAAKYTVPPVAMGVDTWGIDFMLLDAHGALMGPPFAYRDRRTCGAMEEFLSRVTKERLYQLTGVAFFPFNTLFQLYSMVRDGSPQLGIAAALLFIPDVLNYFITGVKRTELSFATTSQLFNPRTGDWEEEIFRHLGVPKSIMQRVVQPGTFVGELSEDLSIHVGLARIPVVAVASHDTSSAVAAIPTLGKRFAFISSGTWSIMGIESSIPIIDESALKHNFTNEGGVCGTFQLSKNITGLWLLRQCRNEWARTRCYSYDELVQMAERAAPFRSVIDPDSPQFLNPTNMPLAIQEFCREKGEPVPEDEGQFVRSIVESLALAYRCTLEQLEEVTGPGIEQIHIVGGGSRNHLLCQFTADATGLPVHAGPVEATAIGNVLVQAMASGRILSLDGLRETVRRSFKSNLYEPRCTREWDEPYERFMKLKRT